MHRSWFTTISIFITLPFFITLPLSHSSERPSIKASDVVFMYSAKDPGQYDLYMGTVVGWGGLTRTRDAKSVKGFQQRVQEAQKRGMRYCGSVNFLVDFSGFIDFAPDTFMEAVCRDLEGNPLTVPWLWDHKYKGHPAYWFCTNNPTYQTYLLDQTERACLAPIDGLHIDDYSGTSHCSSFLGGCFCRYCMKGFRDYLREHFSQAQRDKLGIKNIDTFDYGTYLKAQDITTDDIKKRPGQCPLRTEFQDYQNQQMKMRLRTVYEHAEKIRGKLLVRSINSSASSPRTVIPHAIIDYFCGEIPQQAASQSIRSDPVFVYRMVEALESRQTATASGHDWAWIKANDKPGLVKGWIAQTYAFGSVFMVPHRQWCYTQKLGTHWYHGKPEDFAYLYRFVRNHASYFDDYETLADVTVLITNNDFYSMKNVCQKLTEANIQYRILFTPDPSKEPINDDFSLNETVILSKESNAKARWIRDQKASPLLWDGEERVLQQLKPLIRVVGKQPVRVSLRCNPANKQAPVICHLLNQKYDVQSDKIEPLALKMILSKEFVQKYNIKEGILHAPTQKVRTIPMKPDSAGLLLSIDDLDLWGMVVLKRTSS